MKKITINGKVTQTQSTTVDELLEELKIPQEGVAIAINAELIPSKSRSECMLEDGDCVEIIRPIGGG